MWKWSLGNTPRSELQKKTLTVNELGWDCFTFKHYVQTCWSLKVDVTKVHGTVGHKVLTKGHMISAGDHKKREVTWIQILLFSVHSYSLV